MGTTNPKNQGGGRMKIDESKREVKESKVNYYETAEEVFTLNIGCPHCKKTISLSLAKLELNKK